MTATAQSLVSVSRERDGVALIHLNRPPANSYDRAFLDDLNAAVDQVRWDADLRGAVLVSDLAPRFFSAGADINNFKNSTQRLTRLVGRTRALDMMITNQQIGPARALEIGLVESVFAADRLVEEASD